MTKTQREESTRGISHEWNGVEVHPAKTGWVVEFSSQITGRRDGRKLLVPYSDLYPADMKLTRNAIELLAEIEQAEGNYSILDRGQVVR